jgi:hypothetical protein
MFMARPVRPSSAGLEHDPEKWIPVFGKDHAQPIDALRLRDVARRSMAVAGTSIALFTSAAKCAT